MIKNVIFDLGEVLVEWKPRNLLRNFTDDEEDLDLLEIICTSNEWERLDEGTITKEEVFENVAKRLPSRLRNIAKKFIYHYAEYLVLNDDICEIAIKLKENGYFEKFNLEPEECFFIDDKEENILGGQKVGMNGHVLDRDKYGTIELLKDFKKYGIKSQDMIQYGI